MASSLHLNYNASFFYKLYQRTATSGTVSKMLLKWQVVYI